MLPGFHMNGWMQKLRMRFPVFVLLGASLLFWGYYDRYESAGPVLLSSPALSGARHYRGDCAEVDGRLLLSVTNGGKTASINFRIPTGTEYEWVRLSGRIKTEGVVEGKYSWSCARLLLVQYDENNKWIPGHHTLKAERGTVDWTPQEHIFEIMPEAEHIDVVIQQIGLEGSAEFDQIVVEPVQFRPSFNWWRMFFFCSWICMGVLFFRRCRLDRRRLRVLILFNALAILSGTLMPEQWIEKITVGLSEVAAKMKDDGRISDPQPSDKPTGEKKREGNKADLFESAVGSVHRTGHFLLFASLCFLVYLSAALEQQHWIYFFKVAFDILMFACITESLQYLTLDRTPGITDWMTDVYGMLAAFIFFLIVLGIRRMFQVLRALKGV
jgi:hypothetical protein